MRLRLPWGRRARARRVLAAARAWQDYERRQACARLAELAAASYRDWTAGR
jgi:hypothetical protein